jgi:molybdopterin synthase sulfur carrier subunit
MAQINFTINVQRHLPCPVARIEGHSVAEVLEGYFSLHPQARGYVLDDQGAVRKHMVIMIDGLPIRDRAALGDAAESWSEIHIIQALSGG